MAALTVPETQGARVLRRVLPYAIAGLLAAGIMAGFNIAFAQESLRMPPSSIREAI